MKIKEHALTVQYERLIQHLYNCGWPEVKSLTIAIVGKTELPFVNGKTEKSLHRVVGLEDYGTEKCALCSRSFRLDEQVLMFRCNHGLKCVCVDQMSCVGSRNHMREVISAVTFDDGLADMKRVEK